MCKQVGRDLNNCIGVFIPAMKFKNLPDSDERKRNYKGYDLTKFGTYFAVISILVNRDGESDVKIPVFFDGKVCIYEELPSPKDIEKLQLYYNRIEKYKAEEMQERREIDIFRNRNKKDSSLFLSFSKNYNNKFGCKDIIKYLCSFFNRK